MTWRRACNFRHEWYEWGVWNEFVIKALHSNDKIVDHLNSIISKCCILIRRCGVLNRNKCANDIWTNCNNGCNVCWVICINILLIFIMHWAKHNVLGNYIIILSLAIHLIHNRILSISIICCRINVVIQFSIINDINKAWRQAVVDFITFRKLINHPIRPVIES